MFHSWGRFLGQFNEFVRFGKNGDCASMALWVPKMVLSQLSQRIKIWQLENSYRRRFFKLGDFNKIAEKLAHKGIFTYFRQFSNFCKNTLSFSEIRREICWEGHRASMVNHTWGTTKFCVRMRPSASKKMVLTKAS